MKKKFFALAMSVIMTCAMSVSAFAADTTSDLIAKYLFDGTLTNEVTGTDATTVAKASSGQTAVDGKTWEYTDGVDGQALVMASDNTDGLKLDVVVADGQNFTVSLWVKAEGCQFAGPIFWAGKAVQSAGENWIGIWPGLYNNYANGGPCIGSNNADGSRYGVTAGSTTEGWTSPGAVDSDGDGDQTTFEWMNVTAVIENGVGYLYYNGVLVGTNVGVVTTDADGNDVQVTLPDLTEGDDVAMCIGCNAWDSPFIGEVDSLYIYNRALTSDDVAALVKETNTTGVSLYAYTEIVTTEAATTTTRTAKVADASKSGWLSEEEDEASNMPLIIGIIVAAVVVIAVIAVVVIAQAKKKKKAE